MLLTFRDKKDKAEKKKLAIEVYQDIHEQLIGLRIETAEIAQNINETIANLDKENFAKNLAAAEKTLSDYRDRVTSIDYENDPDNNYEEFVENCETLIEELKHCENFYQYCLDNQLTTDYMTKYLQIKNPSIPELTKQLEAKNGLLSLIHQRLIPPDDLSLVSEQELAKKIKVQADKFAQAKTAAEHHPSENIYAIELIQTKLQLESTLEHVNKLDTTKKETFLNAFKKQPQKTIINVPLYLQNPTSELDSSMYQDDPIAKAIRATILNNLENNSSELIDDQVEQAEKLIADSLSPIKIAEISSIPNIPNNSGSKEEKASSSSSSIKSSAGKEEEEEEEKTSLSSTTISDSEGEKEEDETPPSSRNVSDIEEEEEEEEENKKSGNKENTSDGSNQQLSGDRNSNPSGDSATGSNPNPSGASGNRDPSDEYNISYEEEEDYQFYSDEIRSTKNEIKTELLTKCLNGIVTDAQVDQELRNWLSQLPIQQQQLWRTKEQAEIAIKSWAELLLAKRNTASRQEINAKSRDKNKSILKTLAKCSLQAIIPAGIVGVALTFLGFPLAGIVAGGIVWLLTTSILVAKDLRSVTSSSIQLTDNIHDINTVDTLIKYLTKHDDFPGKHIVPPEPKIAIVALQSVLNDRSGISLINKCIVGLYEKEAQQGPYDKIEKEICQKRQKLLINKLFEHCITQQNSIEPLAACLNEMMKNSTQSQWAIKFAKQLFDAVFTNILKGKITLAAGKNYIANILDRCGPETLGKLLFSLPKEYGNQQDKKIIVEALLDNKQSAPIITKQIFTQHKLSKAKTPLNNPKGSAWVTESLESIVRRPIEAIKNYFTTLNDPAIEKTKQ